MLDIISMIIL